MWFQPHAYCLQQNFSRPAITRDCGVSMMGDQSLGLVGLGGGGIIYLADSPSVKSAPYCSQSAGPTAG